MKEIIKYLATGIMCFEYELVDKLNKLLKDKIEFCNDFNLINNINIRDYLKILKAYRKASNMSTKEFYTEVILPLNEVIIKLHLPEVTDRLTVHLDIYGKTPKNKRELELRSNWRQNQINSIFED